MNFQVTCARCPQALESSAARTPPFLMVGDTNKTCCYDLRDYSHGGTRFIGQGERRVDSTGGTESGDYFGHVAKIRGAGGGKEGGGELRGEKMPLSMKKIFGVEGFRSFE